MEHTDAGWLGRALREMRQREREGRTAVDLVRDDGARVRIGHRGDLEPAVLADPHAAGPLIEDDRLPVHQTDLVVYALLLISDQVERAVVEHVAVLVDLDERRAGMLSSLSQHV